MMETKFRSRWLLMVLLITLPALAQEGGLESLRQTGKAFAAVARQVSPAVVSVQTERVSADSAPQRMPFGDGLPFDDDLLDRFFGDLMPEQRPGRRPAERPTITGQGSGFVLRTDRGARSTTSFILTNYHVVEDAGTIRVRLQDGSEFEAKVKGADPQSDVAVLEVEGADLPVLPIGDSSALEVGEWVLAVGNPFGLQHTLTVGVVSAKGRTSLGINDYEDFIQTDAAINPGNSGGPLVNLDGEAVGMNTAIFSRSGGHMGVGFAIPIDLASSVATQLIEKGEVVRGYLGVVIQELTPDLARSFGLEWTRGVVVAQVEDGGPADQAGLRVGDVIVSYQGAPVINVGSLRNNVALTPPGTRSDIGILRDGKKQTLSAAIGRLTGEKVAAAGGAESAGELGLTVQTITPALARQFDTAAGEGVVVTRVEPGSVGASAGIDAGSVILQVDRQPVRSAEEFTRRVAQSRDDGRVMFLVRQGRQQRYVVLQWR